MKLHQLALTTSALLVLALAACGGGGSSSSSTAAAGAASTASAGSGAASSGAITAFGSVFVNGHEFATTHAVVVDDDTGVSVSSTAALEVGEVVDVMPATNSTTAAPVASALHVHPLARGYVDASSATASTITVMGQTVQLTSSTTFSAAAPAPASPASQVSPPPAAVAARRSPATMSRSTVTFSPPRPTP